MKIQVIKWTLKPDDHLWLENSETSLYSDNDVCEGCGDTMENIAMITNSNGMSGLATGLCPSCGYVKRTRNLSQEWYGEHFSKRWLTRRDEKITEDKYVFNKLIKHIPEGGKVLDAGCGIGQRLLPFYNAGYDVYGFDPSEHRSEIAAEAMGNIETGIAEDYLESDGKTFDLIYFFNVMQFVENPFLVLEMAAKRLSNGGVLFFSVGQFYNDSNFCQFSHLGLIRSFLSLYSMSAQFEKLDLWPVEYSEAPFEVVLKKGGKSNVSLEILKNASKITVSDIERYAHKTLHPFQLKFFGKASVKYQGRKIELKKAGEFREMVPVIFEYKDDELPILLK